MAKLFRESHRSLLKTLEITNEPMTAKQIAESLELDYSVAKGNLSRTLNLLASEKYQNLILIIPNVHYPNFKFYSLNPKFKGLIDTPTDIELFEAKFQLETKKLILMEEQLAKMKFAKFVVDNPKYKDELKATEIRAQQEKVDENHILTLIEILGKSRLNLRRGLTNPIRKTFDIKRVPNKKIDQAEILIRNDIQSVGTNWKAVAQKLFKKASKSEVN